MKCPFCKVGTSEDNVNFDKSVEHLIIVFNAEGHTHVHGPFSNEYALRKMADALLAEMEKNGIKYIPPVKHNIGD